MKRRLTLYIASIVVAISISVMSLAASTALTSRVCPVPDELTSATCEEQIAKFKDALN